MTKEELKEWLLYNMEDAKLASGGKQIVCRCHNCDDHSRHLYIGPFDDSDKPIQYQCKRCPRPFYGVVNKDFLERYRTATAVPEDVNEVNKGTSKHRKTINGTSNKIYTVNRNYITDAPLTQQKLAHINKRLGLSLSYQDCIDNKIILNLGDLYRGNPWIKRFTRHENIVQQLDKYFIGFLSRSNASLNMRNLVYEKGIVYEGIDKKYVNYNLFNEGVENDYYLLPVTVDPLQPIGLHIAEGPFDVLGIKYNVVGPQVPNQIYIAGKGKAYDKIVEFIITRYGFMNLTLNFYPDKDVNDYEMSRVVNIFKPFGFEQFIYRNTYQGEKDFGVPRDRIICSKFTPGLGRSSF